MAERTTIEVEDGRFIIDNYRTVAEIIDRQPNTVTHGDAHPGNVYFRNGEAGLLDWQAVRRGRPGRELAYTLITGMTTETANATFSPPTGMPWPLTAAPNSMPTNSGCATGRAQCMPTSHP
jgi:hypothetical protein